MLHPVLLVAHYVAGTIGLLLGPLAMRHDVRGFVGGQRATGRVSRIYRVVVLLVCLSATVLVIENRPELWWLVPVSALTYGLAVLARESARRRFRGWTHVYVHGQGGSYIALVTAFVVVELTVDGPVTGPAQLIPWLAPTVLGTVLIEMWRRRLEIALATGLRPSTPPRDPGPSVTVDQPRAGARSADVLVEPAAPPRPVISDTDLPGRGSRA